MTCDGHCRPCAPIKLKSERRVYCVCRASAATTAINSQLERLEMCAESPSSAAAIPICVLGSARRFERGGGDEPRRRSADRRRHRGMEGIAVLAA